METSYTIKQEPTYFTITEETKSHKIRIIYTSDNYQRDKEHKKINSNNISCMIKPKNESEFEIECILPQKGIHSFLGIKTKIEYIAHKNLQETQQAIENAIQTMNEIEKLLLKFFNIKI